MSTMLKTAAMTLLSKTLQTFLYKYLSDVDVEGIALPSVYDGSGWGVRLSNVKLREGVQLMKQLPGKLKKTRRRPKKQSKKKKKKNSRLKPSDDNFSHITSTTREGEQQQQQQMNGKARSNNGSQPLHQQQEQQRDQLVLDESIHIADLKIERRSSKDYFEEDEAERGRPPTPDQNSKSIFSCFQKSSRASSVAKNTTPDNDGDNDNDEQPNNLPDIPSGIQDNTANASRHKPPERVESELTLETSFQTSNPPINDNLHRDSTIDLELDAAEDDALSKEAMQSSLAVDNDEGCDDDEEEEEYSDDDDDQEEEEFEEYEQPLKLSLGENGRIGILDIRLIGKELHVLVEDAVLTIEAIPIAEDDIAENNVSAEDADGDNNSINNQNFNVDDDASRISGNESMSNAQAKQSSQQAPKTKEDGKKKPDEKRDTVGDRVLADNPLARAIASIPHLFLRDIRIRLVMRTGDAEPLDAKNDSGEVTEPQTNNDGMDVQPNDNDCILEIGIEFLSVTSGEDVLSHFQQEQDEGSDDEEYSEPSPSVTASRPPPMSTIQSFSSIDNTLDQNEYLVRHIRTGRGPSAGLSVQIFSPIRTTNPWDGKSDFIWARQQWMLATEFYLFRCSGLDVRAKIPLGTKTEVANHSWFYGDYQDSDEIEYDESTLDSLIIGVDHVAPGPQLPLPPINPHMSRGGTPRAADQEESLGAASEEQDHFPTQNPGESFYTDQNGIQSCQIPSSFHRVARGMIPASPERCTHLPSQICPHCWNAPHAVKEYSDLDDSIPLPGLTLQLSMRDPLELNIDRDSLNTVGRVISLFKKKQAPSDSEPDADSDENEREESSNTGQEATAQTEDSATETTASTSYFGSILGSSAKKNKEPAEEKKMLSDAFAKYMQPENIQVLGVYLSEIRIRLHVMSEMSVDGGMSFCYWDLMTKCNTIDLQLLKSHETNFRDVRLDVGYLSWYEYRGVERNEILSLGTPFPERRRTSSNASFVSVATVATVKETEEQSRMPWPSTASVLIATPPPLETVIYKSRERHGIQMRFVSVSNNSNPTGEINPLVRSFINMRLGVMSLSAPWGFWRKFGIVRKEALKCIRTPVDAGSEELQVAASDSRPKAGPPVKIEDTDRGKTDVTAKMSTETSSTTKQKPAPKSLMKYKIQLDGGSMILDPVLHTKMPLTSFCGERSTDSGIFIESIFQKLEFAYGGKNKIPTGKLDIGQLANLPENVRMRILLCLDDLGPLEEAFYVKKESNSFKRCRAVNKGILKLAKKVRKARQKSLRGSIHATGSIIGGGGNSTRSSSITSIGNNKNSSRRQEIMNEFMKMSDVELEELWSLKQKNKKKLAKANSKRASFKT